MGKGQSIVTVNLNQIYRVRLHDPLKLSLFCVITPSDKRCRLSVGYFSKFTGGHLTYSAQLSDFFGLSHDRSDAVHRINSMFKSLSARSVMTQLSSLTLSVTDVLMLVELRGKSPCLAD